MILQFKRKVDLWLFENDVGFTSEAGYLGRWAIHAFARAGYGSDPVIWDIVAITDNGETAAFDLQFDNSGQFVNKAVSLLGTLKALISNEDIERIRGFYHRVLTELEGK